MLHDCMIAWHMQCMKCTHNAHMHAMRKATQMCEMIHKCLYVCFHAKSTWFYTIKYENAKTVLCKQQCMNVWMHACMCTCCACDKTVCTTHEYLRNVLCKHIDVYECALCCACANAKPCTTYKKSCCCVKKKTIFEEKLQVMLQNVQHWVQPTRKQSSPQTTSD